MRKMNGLPSGAGSRRTFPLEFKRDLLLVYDYFTEISPQLGGAFLRMANIPPRYVRRWRVTVGHIRAPGGGHRSNAVHYPRAGVYRGRHRAPRRSMHPEDAARLHALHTVVSYLVSEQYDRPGLERPSRTDSR